ncbi:GDSL-type esterase/lipase family protein [Streptomyces dysideae]|nr:GDSL-type esterase/lipase family protein [Streptomyces dysideae]
MTRIAPDDSRLSYHGAVSLQHTDDGIAPWRVPHEDSRLFFPKGGLGRAAMPSGVRVAFSTDSRHVTCRYRATPPPEVIGPQETARLDVVVDGELRQRVLLDTEDPEAELTVSGLSGQMSTIELWLPHFNQFVLRGFDMDKSARIEQVPVPGTRWVHYGSSISQGRGAAGPSETWTSVLARTAHLDLTSMAMGAGCHAQPIFASLARDLLPELFTACLGINPYYFGSLNEQTYQSSVIGFVRTVRESNPDTPIVVMSTVYLPEREDDPGPVGMTLKEYRAETEEAVARVRDHGDPLVHYLDGLSLWGPGDERLMLEPEGMDRIHFNSEGHRVFARRMLDALVGMGVVKQADEDGC